VTTALEGYLGEDWPGCRQVFRLLRERRTGGEIEVEVIVGITSLSRERGGAAAGVGAPALGDRERAARSAGRDVEGGRQPGAEGLRCAGDGDAEEPGHLPRLVRGQAEPGGDDPSLHLPPRAIGETRVNPKLRMKRPRLTAETYLTGASITC
jgi:hypothetical protein